MTYLPFNPELVSCDEISAMEFPATDVLISNKQIQQRRTDIFKAAAIGHTQFKQTRIIFEDGEDLKQVDTVIWAAGDSDVVLSEGVILPVSCIHQVII